MKKYLAGLAIPALLLLAGGGCQNLYPPNPENTSDSKTESPVSQNPPSSETAMDEFNFKVEALNEGLVKFTWDAPQGMDPKTETFLLLHSAKPEPVYPGAFWYRRVATDREGVWGNIPAGQRYFRICESKDGQCVKYSKVVALEIK